MKMNVWNANALRRRGRKKRADENTPVSQRKKRRLKYIAVLPSFITLMNGVCGFIAITLASRSPVTRWNAAFLRRPGISVFALAGFMIFLAMIADMLDGRVARLTRTTSSFGGQLDSLSDAISFGVAPAFLMLKLAAFHMENLRFDSPQFPVILGRGIILSAIFYTMCAVVRLARFNVENEEDESSHMNFSGLPSPGAAGVVASLVVLHQHFAVKFSGENENAAVLHILDIVTVYALPVITLSAGLLMVTRIRYPHLANQIFRGKKTLPVFLAFFAAALFAVWNIQIVLTAGFCGFALFGVLRWIVLGFARKRAAKPDAAS